MAGVNIASPDLPILRDMPVMPPDTFRTWQLATAGGYLLLFAFCAAMLAMGQLSARRAPASVSGGGYGYTRPGFPYLLLALLPAALLTGLRYYVGTDYGNYMDVFDRAAQIDSLRAFWEASGDVEPGFILLNMLGHTLTGHFLSAFALSAALTYFFFARALAHYSERLPLSLASFVLMSQFFAQATNIMRQFIAIAIVFYAIRFIEEKRAVAYYLCIALTMTFHITAAIMLPFYFAAGHGRLSAGVRIGICAAFMGFVTLCLVRPDLTMGNAMLSRYLEGGSLRSSAGILLMRLPMLMPLLFAKRLLSADKRFGIWLFMLGIEVLCAGLDFVNEVFNRTALYFSMSWVVLLPATVGVLEGRTQRILMRIYCVGVCLLFFWWNVVRNNFGTSLPYQMYAFWA